METTTILLPVGLRDRLRQRKTHPRQAYHEVIERALDLLDKSSRAPGRLDPLVAAKRDALLAAARENGIDRLWLFGSRARGDARPDSDVDLLYEARPGKSLWDVCPFILDAKDILGIEVDLVERASLRGAFRDRVAHEAVPL